MTDLERLARAACFANGTDPDEPIGPARAGLRWQAYVSHVRAVLLALREPSEGMVDAGGWGAANAAGYDVPVAFAAMIDHVLAEGK